MIIAGQIVCFISAITLAEIAGMCNEQGRPFWVSSIWAGLSGLCIGAYGYLAIAGAGL